MNKVRGIFENIRNINSTTTREPLDVKESLTSEHFRFNKIIQHGFPSKPTCMAFDPVQRLLAIGNKFGAIRIFGTPGVDILLKHESDSSVVHLQFLINEGALISACEDDSVHLWEFRQKRPQIVQTLQFQKERVTCLSLPFQSKFFYVGTEKGNVHIVQIETFALSGYIINWNKAIDLTQKTHPGCVCHISECPADSGKLLIGFSYGTIVLWDLKTRAAELRFQCEFTLKCITWHYEGKTFMCAHSDGSLSTWSLRSPAKPVDFHMPYSAKQATAGAGAQNSHLTNANSQSTPVSALNSPSQPTPTAVKERERFKAISRVDWKHTKNGEEFVVFTGGLPVLETGQLHCVTVMRGKKAVAMELDHPIVTYCVLCESPYVNEPQNPYAVAVLQNTDLVVVDLASPNYPIFQTPYPVDIHDSPVTYCTYLTDCPSDFIPSLCRVGSKQSRQNFSEKPWPIKGGDWIAPKSDKALSYSEVLITGHADGSVRFWDASSLNLEALYRLRTAKVFDKIPEGTFDDDMDPFAIQRVSLCPDSQLLAVAGQASHAVVFRFGKQETVTEIPMLEVSTKPENCISDVKTQEMRVQNLQRQDSVSSTGSNSSVSSNGSCDNSFYPVKVRGGPQKRPAGFQPMLACVTQWQDRNSPEVITALAVNSTYGLMAYGTEQGIVIVDIVQHVLVAYILTAALYGTDFCARTHQRSPANFNFEKTGSTDADQVLSSPTISECALKTASSSDSVSPTLQQPGAHAPQIVATSNKDVKGACMAIGQQLVLENCNAIAVEQKELPSEAPAPVAPVRKKRFKQSQSQSSIEFRASPRHSLGSVEIASEATEEETMPSAERNMAPRAQSLQLKGSPLLLNPSTPAGGVSQIGGGGVFDVVGEDVELSSSSNNNRAIPPEASRPPTATQLAKKRHSVTAWLLQPMLTTINQKKPKDKQEVPSDKAGPGSSSGKKEKDKELNRSRSSSSSSQEGVPTEGVTFIVFIECSARKNDAEAVPTLWVGTSQGSCIAWCFKLPVPGDQRLNEPIFLSPTGFVQKQRGPVICIAFLDSSFNLLAPPADPWREASKDGENYAKNRVLTKSRVSPAQSTEGASASQSEFSSCYAVVVCEAQAKVTALPSQQCVFKRKFKGETGGGLVRADVVTLDNSPVVMCLTTSSRIQAYSLPTLRCLFDMPLLPSDLRVARTITFAHHGHGLYMCSASEVMKFAYAAELCDALTDMVCDVFMPCNMPEPPKATGFGFLSSIFSNQSQNSTDRQELFGETKGSKNIAKHIPGTAALDSLKLQSGGATSDVARARLLLGERGDKLSDVEEKTQQMMEAAKQHAHLSHELLNKYKNKKWYQF